MNLIEALRLDYETTSDFIDKCDDHMFRVKNWALITASAVIAYSISTDVENIVLANIILVLAFLYLELIYKSFQDTAIEHSTDISKRIDQAIRAPGVSTELDNYEFGFGRKLLYPSLGQCWRILRNGNRRHIVNFYGLIAIFSIGAFLIGRYGFL